MVQKKRKQASSKQKASKKQKQDGQKAVSKDISVPIDEGFNEKGRQILSLQPISRPTLSLLDSLLKSNKTPLFEHIKSRNFGTQHHLTNINVSQRRRLHQPGEDHFRCFAEPDEYRGQ